MAGLQFSEDFPEFLTPFTSTLTIQFRGRPLSWGARVYADEPNIHEFHLNTYTHSMYISVENTEHTTIVMGYLFI